MRLPARNGLVNKVEFLGLIPKIVQDVFQPIPGLVSCVRAMCKSGWACIISLALCMDKASHPTSFSYTRYQSPSPGHSSAADEAWYCPKSVLHGG